MAHDALDQPLIPYQLSPPEWRRAWSTTTDGRLGFPGFGPHCDAAQREPDESEVKDGLANVKVVHSETFSAHQMIYDKLSKPDQLVHMSSLVQAVLREQTRARSIVEPSSFRLPARATLNDQKRDAWLCDLASPDVPLAKLSKTVPHSFKGEKLLSMLVQRRVPISRALWYIKIVGASDIASQRQKPGFSVATYTREFTVQITEMLRRQLAEITMPSSALQPRPGMSLVTKTKSMLSEEEQRLRWTMRVAHSLELVQRLQTENLLDLSVLLAWITEQIETMPAPRVVYVLELAICLVHSYARSTHLSIALIIACAKRMLSSDETLPLSRQGISYWSALLHRLFVADPEVFLLPSLWLSHSPQLEAAILTGCSTIQQQTALAQALKCIAQRSLWITCASPSQSIEANINGNALRPLDLLDGINLQTSDFAKLARLFFGCQQSLVASLELSLAWATSRTRSGNYRQFAVAKLMAAHLHSNGYLARDLQSTLAAWLDKMDASSPCQPDLVLTVFDCLISQNVFDLAIYGQRMIAMGRTRRRHSSDSPRIDIIASLQILHDNNLSSAALREQLALLGQVDASDMPAVAEWLQACRLQLSDSSASRSRATSMNVLRRHVIPRLLPHLIAGSSIHATAELLLLCTATRDFLSLQGCLQALSKHCRTEECALLLSDVVLGNLTVLKIVAVALDDVVKDMLTICFQLHHSGHCSARLTCALRRPGFATCISAHDRETLSSLVPTHIRPSPIATVSERFIVSADVLHDLQALLRSQINISQLGSSLWHKYRDCEGSASIIVKAVIHWLSEAPSDGVFAEDIETVLLLLVDLDQRVGEICQREAKLALADCSSERTAPQLLALAPRLVAKGLLLLEDALRYIISPCCLAVSGSSHIGSMTTVFTSSLTLLLAPHSLPAIEQVRADSAVCSCQLDVQLVANVLADLDLVEARATGCEQNLCRLVLASPPFLINFLAKPVEILASWNQRREVHGLDTLEPRFMRELASAAVQESDSDLPPCQSWLRIAHRCKIELFADALSISQDEHAMSKDMLSNFSSEEIAARLMSECLTSREPLMTHHLTNLVKRELEMLGLESDCQTSAQLLAARRLVCLALSLSASERFTPPAAVESDNVILIRCMTLQLRLGESCQATSTARLAHQIAMREQSCLVYFLDCLSACFEAVAGIPKETQELLRIARTARESATRHALHGPNCERVLSRLYKMAFSAEIDSQLGLLSHIREDDTSCERIDLPTWDLIESVEASASADSLTKGLANTRALDLADFDVSILDQCVDPRTENEGRGLGKRSTFDSETPLLTDALWARDFRRSLRPAPILAARVQSGSAAVPAAAKRKR
ncbi:uncharacterized protein L969DRAFT_105648 [Mixia osmundae IAM 14324]|uniref:Mediator of RNA polymerase II transcription subunit 12 n=1 Tax=Mixia osmundae (strain CBS 9802 / IAM 14324 / JCM 22182 / KY 12970) TaxID=764103 RepID=G7E2N4_MIXOS|nr:uncharacterized protein L969DRAFT_105648 [Mixia osmundae IAM 14324]KEI36959.1 hypothetical protein L969DRAFT_105648 [Mixia osmundae IAM 14324]GAA97094.1 hypothetical protein E5Q_03769 [Mixia osmundae IAM 14324]